MMREQYVQRPYGKAIHKMIGMKQMIPQVPFLVPTLTYNLEIKRTKHKNVK